LSILTDPPHEAAQTAPPAAGDLDAFNEQVAPHIDQLYTTALRLMGGDRAAADDALQEALIAAYRHLDGFRGGSFPGWLRRIVTNTCYDHLRYERRRPATAFDDLPGAALDDGPPLPAEGPSPEELLLTGELADAIQRCIAALGPDQRLVLVMKDIDEYSYEEIAQVAGVALGTVKSRLSRARMAVRACLQGFAELLPPEYRQRIMNTERTPHTDGA
jgi:RNA polymerase sigma-70 factor, ECF subfamily